MWILPIIVLLLGVPSYAVAGGLYYESTPIPHKTRPRAGIKPKKKGVEAYYDRKKYRASFEYRLKSTETRYEGVDNNSFWIRLKFRF